MRIAPNSSNMAALMHDDNKAAGEPRCCHIEVATEFLKTETITKNSKEAIQTTLSDPQGHSGDGISYNVQTTNHGQQIAKDVHAKGQEIRSSAHCGLLCKYRKKIFLIILPVEITVLFR